MESRAIRQDFDFALPGRKSGSVPLSSETHALDLDDFPEDFSPFPDFSAEVVPPLSFAEALSLAGLPASCSAFAAAL